MRPWHARLGTRERHACQATDPQPQVPGGRMDRTNPKRVPVTGPEAMPQGESRGGGDAICHGTSNGGTNIRPGRISHQSEERPNADAINRPPTPRRRPVSRSSTEPAAEESSIAANRIDIEQRPYFQKVGLCGAAHSVASCH